MKEILYVSSNTSAEKPPFPKDFGTYMGWFAVSKRTVTAKIAIMFIVKVPGHPLKIKLSHLCLRPCFVLVGPPMSTPLQRQQALQCTETR